MPMTDSGTTREAAKGAELAEMGHLSLSLRLAFVWVIVILLSVGS